MDLLLLSGNSKRNQAWIYKVRDNFSDIFTKTLIQEYRHWSTNQEFIDIEFELNQLAKEVNKLDKYSVFTKSVGTIIAIRAIASGIIKPEKIMITGFPIHLMNIDDTSLDNDLVAIDIPILVIQNENDPVASFSEVKEYINEIGIEDKIKLIKLPGNTHSYEDLEKLHQLAMEFYLS